MCHAVCVITLAKVDLVPFITACDTHTHTCPLLSADVPYIIVKQSLCLSVWVYWRGFISVFVTTQDVILSSSVIESKDVVHRALIYEQCEGWCWFNASVTHPSCCSDSRRAMIDLLHVT